DRRAVQAQFGAQRCLTPPGVTCEHRQGGELHTRHGRRHVLRPCGEVGLLCPAQEMAGEVLRGRDRERHGAGSGARRSASNTPSKKAATSAAASRGRTAATYWSGRTITTAPD